MKSEVIREPRLPGLDQKYEAVPYPLSPPSRTGEQRSSWEARRARCPQREHEPAGRLVTPAVRTFRGADAVEAGCGRLGAGVLGEPREQARDRSARRRGRLDSRGRAVNGQPRRLAGTRCLRSCHISGTMAGSQRVLLCRMTAVHAAGKPSRRLQPSLMQRDGPREGDVVVSTTLWRSRHRGHCLRCPARSRPRSPNSAGGGSRRSGTYRPSTLTELPTRPLIEGISMPSTIVCRPGLPMSRDISQLSFAASRGTR